MTRFSPLVAMFLFANLVFVLPEAQAQFFQPDEVESQTGLQVPRGIWESSVKIAIDGEECSATRVGPDGFVVTALHCLKNCVFLKHYAKRSAENPKAILAKDALYEIPTTAYPMVCQGILRQRGGLEYSDTKTDFLVWATGPGLFQAYNDHPDESLLHLARADLVAYQKLIQLGFLGPTSRLDYAVVQVGALRGPKTECVPIDWSSFVASRGITPEKSAVLISWPGRTSSGLAEEGGHQADGYQQWLSTGRFFPPRETQSRIVNSYLNNTSDLGQFQMQLANTSSDLEAFRLYIEGRFLDSEVVLGTAPAANGSSGGGILASENWSLQAIVSGPNDLVYKDLTLFREVVSVRLADVHKDLTERLSWNEARIQRTFDCGNFQ